MGSQARARFFASLSAPSPELPPPGIEQTTHVNVSLGLREIEIAESIAAKVAPPMPGPIRKRMFYDNSRRTATAVIKKALKRPIGRRLNDDRKDRSRIAQCLANPCHCARRNCFSQFRESPELPKLLCMFAKAKKQIQDHALHLASRVNRDSSSPGDIYSLLGKAMGRKCFLSLLVIGRTRLKNCINSHYHCRAPVSKPRRRPKESHADNYFLSLYVRLGETLPNRFHRKLQARRHRRRQADRCGSSSSGAESGADGGTKFGPEDGAGDDEIREHCMADRSLWTRYVDSGIGHDITRLPLRFLPPGTVSDLYRDYKLGTGREHCASYSIFGRRWKAHWSNILHFRQPTDFTDCDRCFNMERAMREARTPESKAIAMKSYKLHIDEVTKARDIEEVMRTTPPHGVPTPVLVLMTDGMDQSHWSVPRMRHLRGPKSWAKYIRPRCKVQGVWVFFVGVFFFVADHSMPHDSNMTVECIALALERVRIICRRRGWGVPKELVVWADNTARENKNSTVMSYLSYLIAIGMFRLACMCNHFAGHTHNILDQLYGVIARAMQFCDRLEDVWAVAERVRGVLRQPGLQHWFEGAEVEVDVLESVRQWDAWFARLGIKWAGGMLSDSTSLHCWMFLGRRGVAFTHLHPIQLQHSAVHPITAQYTSPNPIPMLSSTPIRAPAIPAHYTPYILIDSSPSKPIHCVAPWQIYLGEFKPTTTLGRCRIA